MNGRYDDARPLTTRQLIRLPTRESPTLLAVTLEIAAGIQVRLLISDAKHRLPHLHERSYPVADDRLRRFRDRLRYDRGLYLKQQGTMV